MKHIFLGNNTPDGFCSLYEQKMDKIGRLYVLKGTSGCGKSTLIKKVGKRAEEQGFKTEYWHCSGDADSMDGVYIEALDTAVADGTYPHVIEPKVPVAVETLVPLADFVKKDAVVPNTEAIKKLIYDKKRCYACAYNMLKAAYCNFVTIEEYYLPYINDRKIEALADSWREKIGDGFEGFLPRERAFRRAVAPQGYVVFDEVFEGKTLVNLRAETDLLRKRFLSCLVDGSCDGLGGGSCFSSGGKRRAMGGLGGIEIYHDNLQPTSYEAVVAGEFAFAVNVCGDDFVNLNSCLLGAPDSGKIETLKRSGQFAIELAIEELKRVKKLHFEIEKYYIDAIDFDGLNQYSDKLLDEIFG